MRYLLDTNALIGLARGKPQVLQRVRQHQPSEFGISAITMHELYYGAFKSQKRPQNLMRLEALRFEVLEFDREDARRAGEIRAALAGARTQIGPYDVLIAGQACMRELTLIPHNFAEFSRVPGLSVEDWED